MKPGDRVVIKDTPNDELNGKTGILIESGDDYWDFYVRLDDPKTSSLKVIGVEESQVVVLHDNTIFLIYLNENGESFTQMLGDLINQGTLIDPETGDDMRLIGWTETDV